MADPRQSVEQAEFKASFTCPPLACVRQSAECDKNRFASESNHHDDNFRRPNPLGSTPDYIEAFA
jgi:hypothetical protein